MSDRPGPHAPRKVHMVSLGCPKNRVDGEVMLGALLGDGAWEVTGDPSDADLVIVNTCTFLQQAMQESIDTILELAEYKRPDAKLVATGCMVQAHGAELAVELPEVDGFVGLDGFPRILDALTGDTPRVWGRDGVFLYDEHTPRVVSLPGPAAYVKIAEGCDRSCSFCKIPSIRGRQQSRTIQSIVDEVASLADGGIGEVNLIAQDLTAFGQERGGHGQRLEDLLDALVAIDGVRWIRLLYLYPNRITDRLVELVAGSDRILPYLDIPLQHISDPILEAMARGHGARQTRDLIARLRRDIPGLTLRSTFIVGFPGETEAQFQELMGFVREFEPERIAVFRFSPEPGTRAADLPDRVPHEVAAERHERLTELGAAIAAKANQAMVGQRIEVLVEGPSEESDLLWQGRAWCQGPEDMDGVTYLGAGSVPGPGIYEMTVTEAHTYDLVATPPWV